MTAAAKSKIEAPFESRLNAAKHRNPPAVIAALNIPTALIGEKITVTCQSGQIWAGAIIQEYCISLGRTEAEAEEKLNSLGL